jgi:hypothetical protein
MCSHDEFDILFYHNGVMIRKCKHCGEIEMNTEHWISVGEMFGFLEDLAKDNPKLRKALAKP